MVRLYEKELASYGRPYRARLTKSRILRENQERNTEYGLWSR